MFLFIFKDGTSVQKEMIEDEDMRSIDAGELAIYQVDEEITFQEILEKMLENNNKLPSKKQLANIDGIAFRKY